MSQLEKLIERMRAQPSGVRPDEAERVLRSIGYRLDRQKGSHMQFINSSGEVLTIPNKNPLKAVYVKDILSKIEQRKDELK